MNPKHIIKIGFFIFFLMCVVQVNAEGNEHLIYLPILSRDNPWVEVGPGSASGRGISRTYEDASRYPSVAVAPDGTVYVTWQERVDYTSETKQEIFVKAWNGYEWGEVGAGSASEGGISNTGEAAWLPSIAVSPGGMVYVAWWQAIGETEDEIYIRAWNGSSWIELGEDSASGSGISKDRGGSTSPSLAVDSDGTLYVAWGCHTEELVNDIYVMAWDGSSWEEVGEGSASGGGISQTGKAHDPSIGIAPDGTPYVTWENWNNEIGEIYVRAWNGSSWEEVGEGSASGGGISHANYLSWDPKIAVSPSGTPYIAWQNFDSYNDIFAVYIRTWNGISWVEVGEGSASGNGMSEAPFKSGHPSLAFALDGTLYMTWSNGNSLGGDAYVMAWDGSSWREVGIGSARDGGISQIGNVRNPVIAITPDRRVFVSWYAYFDDNTTSSNDEIYIRQYKD